MRTVKQLLTTGAAAVAAIALLPGVANASSTSPPCSLQKAIPGVSIYYKYCDWQGHDPDLGSSGWDSMAYMENNHGAAETIYTQVNLEIQGVANYLPERAYYVHAGTSKFDPYGGVGTMPTDVVVIGYNHDCTIGKTYFPIVRMKLGASGAWGPWAGAPKFVCAF